MCASEVDSDGYLTAWDYCDTCCPGASVESTPQLEANPANEPGNCCKYSPWIQKLNNLNVYTSFQINLLKYVYLRLWYSKSRGLVRKNCWRL